MARRDTFLSRGAILRRYSGVSGNGMLRFHNVEVYVTFDHSIWYTYKLCVSSRIYIHIYAYIYMQEANRP